MKTTYRRVAGGDVAATTVAAVAPLFGRWCVLSLTTYCAEGAVAITYGFRGARRDEIEDRPFDALPDGIVRRSEGHRCWQRTVEQKLDAPSLHGEVLPLSEVHEGGTPVARTVADALLRVAEALIETTRQAIRRNLAASLLHQTAAILHERYAAPTRQTATRLLSEINWPLMLIGSGCGESCLQTLDYVLRHNPLRCYDITFDGDAGIEPLHCENVRFSRTALANMRATALLQRVCGERAAAQFRDCGHITVHARGYEFVLTPWDFVRCTDLNGNQATLCIHSRGFSCNPIDELVIAHLWISHKLDEYLRTANILSVSGDFRLPGSEKAAVAQGQDLAAF